MKNIIYGWLRKPAAGWTTAVHRITRKVEREGYCWKSVSDISDIKMHDTVRLAHKPHVEGEIRYIDEENKKVEFNWHGNPIFVHIKKIKRLVKK